MKECERCARILDLACFCKNARKKDGLNTWCRECTSEYKRKYRAENSEKLSAVARDYYEKNADQIKTRVAAARAQDPSLYNKRSLEYQKKNRDAVYARQRAWSKAKRETDIQYRIRNNLRRRLRRALKGQVKPVSAVRELGCSVAYLLHHLESKFHAGMTWENYGSHWHIDHIKPLTAFDLTVAEQAKKACHFTNLQPLIAAENIRKGGANRMEAQN